MTRTAPEFSSDTEPTIPNMSNSDSGPELEKAAVANGHDRDRDRDHDLPAGAEEKRADKVNANGATDQEKADVAAAPADSPAGPPRTAHGFTWLLIVAAILMANFLFATDNTIAANIQPAVVKDFESLNKLAWMGVAFLASSWGTNFFW
jgi:hypothetical protein